MNLCVVNHTLWLILKITLKSINSNGSNRNKCLVIIIIWLNCMKRRIVFSCISRAVNEFNESRKDCYTSIIFLLMKYFILCSFYAIYSISSN